MRHLRACAGALLALSAALAVADDDYLSSDGLRDVGLVKSWQLHLKLEQDQRLTGAFLVDDQLYVATNDGYVFAIHAATGANRWLRQVTNEGYPIRRPCHAGDRVVFATPTTILQVDRVTGEGIAKTGLRFPGGTPAVTDGAYLFVGGLDQRMHAFSLERPLEGWKTIANAPVVSIPVIFPVSYEKTENDLFFASDDGSVYGCRSRDERYRWQSRTYGSVTGDLAVSEHGVFVPCGDASLYLLDLMYGEIRWRARFSGPLHEPPVLTADLAFQYCPDDGLVAVNSAVVGVQERFRWKMPRGRQALTVVGDHVLILSQDDAILSARLDSGAVDTTIPAGGMQIWIPSPLKPVLFLASSDGRVFCARPGGTPAVTEEQVREALNPPVAAESAAEAAGASSRPATPEASDSLSTSRKGQPIGGKSKVSRDFKPGESARPSKPAGGEGEAKPTSKPTTRPSGPEGEAKPATQPESEP